MWLYDNTACLSTLGSETEYGGALVAMQSGRNETVRGAVLLAAGFVLAGSSVIVGKLAVREISTFIFVCGGLTVALATLVPFRVASIKRTWRMGVREWALVFVQGGSGIVLFRVCLLSGLRIAPAFEAGLVMSFGPLVFALQAGVILREKIPGRVWFAACLAVCALLITRLDGFRRFGDSPVGGYLWFGGAVFFEALLSIVRKKSDHKRPALDHAIYVIFAGWVLSAPLAVIEAIGHPFPGREAILPTLYYGVMATALAYAFWSAGTKRLRGSVVGVVSTLIPLSSMLFSVLLLNEMLTMARAIGGTLALLAMVVAVTRDRSRPVASRST